MSEAQQMPTRVLVRRDRDEAGPTQSRQAKTCARSQIACWSCLKLGNFKSPDRSYGTGSSASVLNRPGISRW